MDVKDITIICLALTCIFNSIAIIYTQRRMNIMNKYFMENIEELRERMSKETL